MGWSTFAAFQVPMCALSLNDPCSEQNQVVENGQSCKIDEPRVPCSSKDTLGTVQHVKGKLGASLNVRPPHVNNTPLDMSGIRRTTIHLLPPRQVLNFSQCACERPLGSRKGITRVHAEEYVAILRKHRSVPSIRFDQARYSDVVSGKHQQQRWQHDPTSHDVKDKEELLEISKIKRTMNVDSAQHRSRTTDGTK